MKTVLSIFVALLLVACDQGSQEEIQKKIPVWERGLPTSQYNAQSLECQKRMATALERIADVLEKDDAATLRY